MVTTAEADAMLPHSLALAGQIGSASIHAAGADRVTKADNDAKLRQLLTGKQMDEEARQAHVAESTQRINDLLKQHPNFSPSIDETGNISLHPIDTLDKDLKRQMLRQGAEDREDRIKGRETSNIQNYFSHEGGKDYGARARTIQNAIDAFKKGDPESQRVAQLELAQAVARGTLTQNEMDAVVGSHSLGNKMQQNAKDLSVAAKNMLPSVIGDPVSSWLSKKADSMDTMTPDEMASKAGLLQHLYDSNKAASDRMQNELRQRAPQLAPSMYRHDPKGLDQVINTLGARISNETPQGPDDKLRALITGKAASPASQAAPKPGQVVDGYRFLGGDPSDQKNWSR